MTVIITDVRGDKSYHHEFRFPMSELYTHWATFERYHDLSEEQFAINYKLISREEEEKDLLASFLTHLRIRKLQRNHERSVLIYTPELFSDFLGKRGWVGFYKVAEDGDPRVFVKG